MADEGVFATSAEVLRKAGENADSTATTEAFTNDFVAQAESEINCVCRFNFSDNYANLNADTRDLLKLAASNYAAMYVIIHNMAGFTSRIEAEDMLNVLRDGYLRAIAILRDQKVVDFLLSDANLTR